MNLDLAKTVLVLRNHFDAIPLLMDTAAKFKDAKSAVQVVDAVVPAQYKIAAIVDDVRAVQVQAAGKAVGEDNLETAIAVTCEAYNEHGNARGVHAKAFLTPGRLRTILDLISTFGPLLLKFAS